MFRNASQLYTLWDAVQDEMQLGVSLRFEKHELFSFPFLVPFSLLKILPFAKSFLNWFSVLIIITVKENGGMKKLCGDLEVHSL